MRKRYIQPVAYSITIEEEDLICATITGKVHSYITNTDGTFYVDNHPYTLEELRTLYPDIYADIISSLGTGGSAKAASISWSDMEVADW